MNKPDVLNFSFDIEQKLLKIHNDLKYKKYKHGNYEQFILCDPKRRIINKALVRDRIVHHSIVRILEPFYDKTFINNSFSSRKNKGLHKGIKTLHKMILSVTRNNTRNAYYLKCDIKKFFDSIDHEILKKILKKNIQDKEILNLIYETINSFNIKPNKGLPLGNYTSQLFSNIYMNEFDQYIKRKLRIKHYIRYCDDFIILDSSKENLEIILKDIPRFLNEKLNLKLHKEKIFINRISKGIDFLGHVVFPNHIILRTRTKKRIIKKFKKRPNKDSLASYVGITKHARASNIKRELNNIYFDSNDKSRF